MIFALHSKNLLYIYKNDIIYILQKDHLKKKKEIQIFLLKLLSATRKKLFFSLSIYLQNIYLSISLSFSRHSTKNTSIVLSCVEQYALFVYPY